MARRTAPLLDCWVSASGFREEEAVSWRTRPHSCARTWATSILVVGTAATMPLAPPASAEPVPGDTTALVSDEPPLLAAGSSTAPSVSADGSRVAFVGRAAKGSDDPGLGRRQVYLWDARTDRVSLVSHAAGSSRPAGCFSTWPDISADGRFVAFSSCATDLGAPGTVPADRQRPNVYLLDTRTGRTSLVSRATSAPGPGGDGFSIDPVLSPHGRYVAFASQADNLVPGTLPFNSDVFLYDRSTRTTSLVSTGRSGERADSISAEPDLVRGARLIVWTSFADNVTAHPDVDDGLDPDVFVTRRSTGHTRLVSRTPTGDGYNREPAVSASGSHVVYTSNAALVPRDTNGTRDVYAHDLADGRTRLVSAPAGGSADNFSTTPAVSASGRSSRGLRTSAAAWCRARTSSGATCVPARSATSATAPTARMATAPASGPR